MQQQQHFLPPLCAKLISLARHLGCLCVCHIQTLLVLAGGHLWAAACNFVDAIVDIVGITGNRQRLPTPLLNKYVYFN